MVASLVWHGKNGTFGQRNLAGEQGIARIGGLWCPCIFVKSDTICDLWLCPSKPAKLTQLQKESDDS